MKKNLIAPFIVFLLCCLFVGMNPQMAQATNTSHHCTTERGAKTCHIASIDGMSLQGQPIATLPSTPSKDLPVDILLVQDLTGTFHDDLPNLRRSTSKVVNSVRKKYPDTWFGLVSFTDKPDPMVGNAKKGYIYRTELPLTADEKELETAIDSLETLPFGGDNEEDPLDALLQASLRSTSELGFREGAKHIAIVITDADYHERGDYACLAKVPPNDGDVSLENNGLAEDYPSIAQVKTALDKAEITPIFLVTGDCLSVYQQLVDQLGEGTVVRLSLSSSNLVSAVNEGLANISL